MKWLTTVTVIVVLFIGVRFAQVEEEVRLDVDEKVSLFLFVLATFGWFASLSTSSFFYFLFEVPEPVGCLY